MATTVRVDDRVAARLRDLADEERRTIGLIIQDALDQYEKEKFWQAVEQSVARLQAKPVAWKAYQQEIRLLEGDSMVGLVTAETYYSEAELEEILDRRARTKVG